MASIALAALFAAPALGHENFTTDRGHLEEDSVIHSAAVESRLAARTEVATAADASVAAAAVVGNEHQVGQWGPLVNWPVVGVHVALLPNGKVLAYDSVGDNATETYAVHDHTRATVWDPATGTQTPVWVNTGFNIFCSGLAHLTDGSLFVAGGNKNAQLDGIVNTHVFNPLTNTWALGPNMAAGRWYPTVTPLRNGEMLITEGGPDMPEVRTTAGGLRALNTASLNLPNYPWIDVAPDGRAFYSGPDQTMRSLDTNGGGAWQSFGQRDAINRNYGGHVLYDVGKMLVAGGGNSSKDARAINLNGATPQVTATAPMASGRRQHNLTVLADGSVLATGGNTSGAPLVDLANGAYTAERWNPATGTWTTMAAEQATRQYHSTALLLPDGRVLSSGGGICGTCDAVGYLAKNAQVFTPPYLFKADGSGEPAVRPVIASAPATATYGAPFEITTPDAASIDKVALVRLGAVTHSVNMEQRYVPLSFSAGAGKLTATGPASANVAPPGVYMLFVIDANGVPSMASMVKLVGNIAPSVSITQPASGATFTAPATVNVAASASDADGTVAKVEFFNGSTNLGEDTTAPFAYSWTGVGAGTYSITTRATDNLGATTTSAARTITVAAAGSFGKSSVGALSDTMAASRKRVNAYSVAAPVSVSRLSMYLQPTATAGVQALRGVIYADVGGVPGALLGVSSELSFASTQAAGWYALPFAAPVGLPAGRYWIGVLSGASSGVAGFRWDSVAGSRVFNLNTYAAGASDPFGAPSTDGEQMSIYASYTAAGGVAPPVNSALPVISGTAQVGQRLSASTGSWSGSPSGYSYQWRRCDASGGACSAVSGATSSTYDLVLADRGFSIRVVVSAINAGGTVSASSAPTAVVQDAPPAAGTFGKTSLGASSDTMAANRKRVNAYSITAPVAVSKLSMYLQPTATTGAQALRGVIYADAGGAPGALLATSTELSYASTQPAGWYALPFAAPVNLAAGRYWIGVLSGATSGVAGFRWDYVAGSRSYNLNTYTAGASDPFGGSTTTDGEQMSIYASYTTA